jgi:hypothetical protein
MIISGSEKPEARSQKPEEKHPQLHDVFFWILTIESGFFWLLDSVATTIRDHIWKPG